MSSRDGKPLRGVRVAITRPVGRGAALMRRVRLLGGMPLSLPGSSLRDVGDPRAARAALRAILGADVLIFSSPAAVRFARRLLALRTNALILAPGRGTAVALHRASFDRVLSPDREDSEGLLRLPPLQYARGRRIGIVGAAGGRGVLERELGKRGGRVTCVQVYRRSPARLDRRHAQALIRGRGPLYVLLSSGEALTNLLAGLPDPARHALLGGTAVVSSPRLAGIARRAGFARVRRADSAHGKDLLATTVAAHRGRAR